MAGERFFAALGCLVFVVTAHAWTPSAPVRMTGQDSLDGRVGVDAVGKLHVVWRENTSGGWQIWYAVNSSGGFNSPTQLSPGPYGSFAPVVACDGPDVHFGWAADPLNNNNWEIYYRKLTAGALGSIVNVSNTPIKSLRPALAVRGGVGPVFAWDEALQADDRYDTFFSGYEGSGFSTAMNISNTPGGSAYGSVNVNVVVSPNGDVTAVWVDRDNGANEYHPNARRRVNGVWQPRQEIATLPLGPSTPGLAAGPDNSVHTIYESGGTLWYQRWNGSSWTAPQALPGGLNDPLRCKIAVDDRGFAHVVCDDSHYGTGEIWYSSNASGNWSGWVNVSNTPGTNSITPDISHNANTLGVVWMENSNQSGGTGVFNIWYARHDLPPPGPSGTLSGLVKTPAGLPVANAAVSCGGREALSNTAGAYTLTAIPVGTYTATAGKQYYSTATVTGVSIAQGGTTAANFELVPTAPGPVTSLAVAAGNTSNVLTWTHSSSGNSTGTMIRVKATGYPAHPADGLLVVDQLALPGSAGGYAHAGLTNGTSYYYAAFAHDDVGTFATGVNIGPATPAVEPDRDRDGDVDQEDFGRFQVCISGASTPQTSLACQWALLDNDNDVDQTDLDVFKRCLTVSGGYAPPACANWP